MLEFVSTPTLHNRVAMVTMHFHIAQMSSCLGTFFLIQGGPGIFFGTNEKLSWGCKVGQIRFCGIGYPISVLIDSFHIVSAHAPNCLVPRYLREITREGATFIWLPNITLWNMENY